MKKSSSNSKQNKTKKDDSVTQDEKVHSTDSKTDVLPCELSSPAVAEVLLNNQYFRKGLPAAINTAFTEDKESLDDFASLIGKNRSFHDTYKQVLLNDPDLYRNFFEQAFRPENNNPEFWNNFTKPFLDDDSIVARLSEELVKRCSDSEKVYFQMQTSSDFLRNDIEKRISLLEKRFDEKISLLEKTKIEDSKAQLKNLLNSDSKEYHEFL